MQGPAELLPVSSSGHLVLVPELLGWPHTGLDPELRKAFEVALHAGTAAALCLALRDEVLQVVRELDPERLARTVITFAVPAAAGAAFERPIEERLGEPARVATAQIVAGAALAAADRRPAERRHGEAGLLDSVLLGLAQAMALAPGVSRGGATLTVARLRRFERPAANRLSRHAALPIILGAAGLKGSRLARRGMPPATAAAFAVGGGAAFASTLAAARLIPVMDRARSYLPFAAYRVALGVTALVVLRRRPQLPGGGDLRPSA